MAEEAAERSHQPTARKLNQAREKGRVPRSQELGSVVTIITLVMVIFGCASFLLTRMKGFITEGIHGKTSVFASPQAFMAFFNEVLVEAMVVSSPMIGALLVAGIAGTLMVGGFTFSVEGLKWRWDSLNPAENMSKMMTTKTLVTFVLSVAKISIISLIIWFYLKDRVEELAVLRWATPGEILSQIGEVILGLCIRVGLALLVIALADVLYQKWKYTDDMRMSHGEVKQENKDTEGSPEVRARVRQIRAQIASQRMRQVVPQADVILVNPTHYAVALKYDAERMEAPVVLAKGADYKAAKIREIARAYGIPIVRRPELTRTIHGSVDVGKPIPEGLYMAVAEVLAVIYRLRKGRKTQHSV